MLTCPKAGGLRQFVAVVVGVGVILALGGAAQGQVPYEVIGGGQIKGDPIFSTGCDPRIPPAGRSEQDDPSPLHQLLRRVARADEEFEMLALVKVESEGPCRLERAR